jgi:hypothetical protein
LRAKSGKIQFWLLFNTTAIETQKRQNSWNFEQILKHKPKNKTINMETGCEKLVRNFRAMMLLTSKAAGLTMRQTNEKLQNWQIYPHPQNKVIFKSIS